MTTRHDIAARVARREFACVNPSRSKLAGHVLPADVTDWLAACDPHELAVEWLEIVGDDNLAELGLDTSHLATYLYTKEPGWMGHMLHILRDRYAKARIVEAAGMILTDLIHDAEDERAGLSYPKSCISRQAWDAGVSLTGEL